MRSRGQSPSLSTNPTEEEQKKYDTVVQKNTSMKFITALYSLVENCEYGALKDKLLRDRLVLGIRDEALSQKLQGDSTLYIGES